MVLPTGLTGGETGHVGHHNEIHSYYNSRIADRGFVFVDGTNGNDSNSGLSLYEAKATIAAGLSTLAAGETLVIAPGRYQQTSQLTVPLLRGIGIESLWGSAPSFTNNNGDYPGVTIEATGATGFTLMRVNSGTSQFQQGPRISGITFHDATTSGDATLLHLHNTNRWDLVRCNFSRPSGAASTTGILMTRETGGDNAWNNIFSCNFHYLDTVWDIQGSYGFRDFGSSIVGGGVDGIKIDGPSQHIKLFGTMLDSCQLHSQGFHIGLFGLKFEAQGSTYPMLRVSEDPTPFGSGTRHMVVGNSFVGSGASEIGIQLDSGAVAGHYIANTYVAVPTEFTDNSGGRNLILGDAEGITGTYTPSNVVTDRAYDANSTTTAELADVLGTLIADLQASGIIG